MDESGWVIERGDSEVSRPRYWRGNGWSYDHMDAIRYARKIDAERTASGFDEDGRLPLDEPHRICEHGWS